MAKPHHTVIAVRWIDNDTEIDAEEVQAELETLEEEERSTVTASPAAPASPPVHAAAASPDTPVRHSA